ncbi:unnamed protein product [Prorocentrum cordatum]|uniref:RRM domain-containing protein n=1 Tax=Prorocentrum cordatum TaxID=2364126 RepID=A0ABN9W8K7_9DINO|nr:unnamed protein product [Polarella glacialis]
MADPSFADAPRQLKVFVGGLSQNSSRESLNAYFQQYDPFVDCYIMKDGRTGRSRGFAFANFADESAMEMLLQLEHNIDGVPVTLSPYNQGKSKGGYKGRPVVMMQQQQVRPPVVHVVGAANPNQSVQSVLGVVNNLLSQQPGGAEVAGALNNAVNAILQQPTQPVPVVVQQVEQRPQGEFKIFVGGLSQETTKESLSGYFSQFGHADAYVMKDGATGRSRGFAFVNFQEQSVVNTVLQMEHQIDGVVVQCSQYRYGGGKGGGGCGGGGFAGGGGGGFVATPRAGGHRYGGGGGGFVATPQQQQHQPGGYGAPPAAASGGGFQSCKLFVGQLATTANETALQGAFSRYNVVRATVCRDASGQPKGFGVVEFGSPADAEAAMAMQPVIDGQQTEVTEYYQKQQPRSAPYGRSNPY